MKLFILSFIMLLAIASPASAQVTYYVNNQHCSASDSNAGTSAALPLKTLQAGVTKAMTSNIANNVAKVYVSPGTYREGITMAYTGTETTKPITIEATVEGQSIVSGSDIWTGWIAGSPTGVYVHEWLDNWGLAPYPSGWAGFVTLGDIVRHREMIVVNGTALIQVLTLGELSKGEFFVDETANLVYIWPASGTDINTALIEVAKRPSLLLAEGKPYLTIRGMVFQHGNAAIQAAAATFNNCPHLTIEESQFNWNNWAGLGMNGSLEPVVRNSKANHNGGLGMVGWQMKSPVFDENETSYNNWRGAQDNFTGWGVAGLKHLLVHDGIYRRHIAKGNQTFGFWLDTDGTNITIEKSNFSENVEDGMFLEALQGPIILRDNKFSKNLRDGLLIGNTKNGTLIGNVFKENKGTQIRLGGAEARNVQDWETHVTQPVVSEAWTWKKNRIEGNGTGLLFVTTLNSVLWAPFRTNFVSDYNTWIHPQDRNGWVIVGGTHVDLSGWRTETGQEVHSTFQRRVP